MPPRSRAAQVIEVVARRFPAPDADNGHLRLVEAYSDGPEVVCVVYQGWWFPGTLGLRRTLEPHLTVEQELANILDDEIGEPPGAMVDGVEPDERGITWWQGDLPGWRTFP